MPPHRPAPAGGPRRKSAATARRRTSIEQRLAIEHGATNVLAHSNSMAVAAPEIIRTVCETLGWACGSCWAFDPLKDTMVCVGTWGAATCGVGEFLKATRQVRQSKRSGGLIRRTWLDGAPVWLRDVTADKTFRRAPVALKAGLRSAFAFPVKAGPKVIGVMEFFSREIHQPDADLLDCTQYIGSQIGQFCQRTEAQERLREIEAQFQSTIELAAIGIAHVGAEGRFLHVNRWLCELLGYTREELLGMSVKQISHPDDKNITDEARARLRAGLINSFQMEKRYVRKDGSVVWVGLTISVKRTPSGEPLHDIAMVEDVSARKQAEEALRQSEARFRSLIDLSSDWYWEQDDQYRLTFMSSRVGEKTGLDPSAYLGRKRWDQPALNLTEADWDKHRAQLDRRERFQDFEMQRPGADSRSVWLSLSGEPVFDADGVFKGYRGVGSDVTARKQSEERIQYLATHDGLTGLPNRIMFSQLLNLEIASARRHERKFAVLFIDLDRFKEINDSLGHEAGDQLLREISARLKSTLRASDVVARLGGDEFVVLLQEVGDRSEVAAVARKILSAVIKPMMISGQECRVTASVGIAMFPENAQDELSLMKHADIAMYLAKEEGKNNFQFYTEGIKSQFLEKLTLETNLRRAMERDEFSLHYQAKLDLNSGAISGVEALLRWNNAELGQVTPAQFIPLAEETGLIVPIGKWVLRTACAQNVAWQGQGLPPVRIAVNLSPRQFADPDLIEDVAAVLRDTGMAPDLLELEITEGMVMHKTERAVQLLGAIKRMGVRITIDDFGTGYSSLSQLKRFPIDTLKVDRSFIREIPMDSEDRAVTEAIIALGKKLSLTVVAEGVETEAQQTFLREHACDQMQGFYFSKPIVPEQFAELLRTHVRAMAR
jgi:diguanylate cyclase (GGDEF)-like protein/PAS domain S-box-containing protein